MRREPVPVIHAEPAQAAAAARAALGELEAAAAGDDLSVHLQILHHPGGPGTESIAFRLGAVLEAVTGHLAGRPEDMHPDAIGYLDHAVAALADDVAGEDGIERALTFHTA
ncbi:hypothetical protein [Kitasatospora sp. NPDC088783]|uniref:hypothetical protein n=1 Tax=Kitasatospora sp. NPDC088783 TaxID=3364077 RepID=UPI003822919A